MVKKWGLAAVGCLIFLAGTGSFAQFLPQDIAEWPKWEEFLAAANVTHSEQLSGPGAVTNPWKLTLEKDGVTRLGLWKNPEGVQGGFLEGWRFEIAAYRMDRVLELNMVAPTVERRFQENRGSIQLWVDSEMTLKQKTEKNIRVPPRYVMGWNRETYLQRGFDNLIANEDRHMNNVLITKDWRIYLIDHSRSFRTAKKFTDSLIYTEKHKEGDRSVKELPRTFVDKLKGLSFESIKAAVGEYLKDDEINSMLKRRDLMLKEVERLIQKNGEENVLY